MKIQKYGLFTSISMIVGIVIGSGIFFKSDDILVFTDGNVALGVVVFVLAAISIIFGGLTVAELAARSADAGGVMSYASEFISDKIGCGFGWFQTFIYIPALTSVVGWVAGIYTIMLFGLENTLELQVGIGMAYIFLLFILNVLSAKLGGYFQNASTVIKLIPLIVIAITGIMYGDASTINPDVLGSTLESTSWIAAVGPVAYAFDGWIISTTLSKEIKNVKRNLPIALIIGPIFVLAMYVLYFVGISMLVGSQNIVEMGDAHLSTAANMIFGPTGANLIIAFIIVSVLGTVNGLIMGLCRLPYALAERNMIPNSKWLHKMDEKTSMPKHSSYLAVVLTVIWMLIHYITQKRGMLPNSDVSEISIVTGYIFYIILYVKVIHMGMTGEIKSFIRSKVNPVLAILGALFILYGGLKNPLFIYFFMICLVVIVGSIIYYSQKMKKQV